MSDVDIVIKAAVDGVEKVHNLSNALQQLNRAIDKSLNPMKNLDARSRALSSAIGSSDSSLKNHAKSVAELTRNNAILTNELGRVRKEISGLGTSYKFASRASSDFKTIAVRDLKAYEESLKGIRVRALVEDLKSLSQEQKRLGKDAQFVGRSLIIGLTTPIMTFSRMGLQSLVAIDKEFVRLNKVLESVAPNIEYAAKKMGVDLNSASKEQNKQLQTMVDRYNELDKALTNTSTKFGMSKSLTVGLAGDFAELGIQTTENIALITELTAKTEKLGNMDVGAAKDLVQSLYFQAVRAMQQSGESVGMPFQERERKAIQAATAQLNLFNSVENVTALTLKDLGDAFPEVAAAATSFGLSMTEAAALLAPMKAAGFETGASANSIKVSLQRLTAPTKQNAEMFKELSKQYNVNFNAIKGTGLDAIQQLVDGFNTLKDSAAGQEGAMEFFAKVFGVRQGPRMEVAIAQMAEFDKLLKNDLIPATNSAEKRLQGYANSAIRSANRTTNANLPVINSFRDIGIVARIATATAGQQVEGLAKKVTQEQINAAKSVRTELSKEILKAQREGGEDLIGQVGTEAGRAMFIELAGTANAAGVAQRELEASLASLDTQLSILKNNFKMFTAELVKSLKPAIEKISEISTKLYNSWSGLDAQTKKLISTVALIAAGATAAIGPLIFVFGQFRLAMGSIGKVLFGFLPGLKTMTIEALAASEGMTRLTKPISMMGDTVVNTNGKFATFIATLSSGDGPVGRMADKLGRMTGVLQETTTAPLPVMRALKAQKSDGRLMTGLDPSLTGGTTAPADIRKLVRTRTGIIDPTDPTARIPRALRKAFAEEEFSMEQQGLRRGGAAGTRYNIRERFGLRGARTGFRSISAADVGEAINLRQEAFDRTGITRTSLSSSLGGGKIMRMGREISEERALGIARGGVKGRALQAYDTATAKSSASMTSALASIKGAPTAAVDSYKKGLQAAKDAQKALRIESLAFTGEGPGAFARMRAGVMGFAKSFSFVNNAIKLTKVTLIASGIGIIILSIGVAVMLIMKNMDKFKEAGSKGLKVVGEAFKIIKNAAMELVRPIVDLFASFGSGAEGTEGAVSGLGNIFNALANVLKFVAQVFSWLVTTIIQPYLYIVVNIVKFIINLFSGNFTEALKSLGAVFAGVFGTVSKLGLEIVGFLVKQIINIFFEIPSAFIKAWAFGIERVTNMFFGFAEFILNQIKRAGPLGKFFGGVGDSVLGGMKNARDAYVGTVRTVAKAVDGAGDFIKRGIDKGVNAAQKSVDKLAKGGVKKSKGKFDLFGGKDENSVDVDTDDAQEKIASASGDGMKEGAEEGSKELAKRAKQALKDLKKEVQEEIADRIKNAMETVVDQIQEALKAQKEASLKVYDDQIKKIEDVAKSEGRLTKEMEYQNRLREAEAERSLNRMNSKRNYALAVYAGNIDEARVIADESARQEIADNQKIDDINKDRAKEIAEQNKADLIDSIKDAKQKASEYFDSMIKTFTDAAKKITEFPPTTAEEFNTMLNQLIEGGNGFIGAKTIANNMGTLFSQSFSGALSQLGVNASGPLTSSLQAIGKTLTDNNPFGVNGIWNKTIDASIDALTRKYKGLTNTLTTVIDTKTDAFKSLYDTYKKYQDLVNPAEGTGGGTTGGTGGGTGNNGGFGKGFNNDGVKIGNKVAIASANADLKKIKDYSDKYLQDKYGNTTEGKRLVASIKGTVGSIASSAVLLGGHDAGMKDYMPIVLASKYRDQITTNSELVYAYIMNNRALFIKGSGAQGRTDENKRSGFFKGGMLPFMMGGATKGPTQQGIPALLHGGEYVVRNSAVKKYGWGMMQQINQGTYKPKPYAIGGLVKGKGRDKAQDEWNWQQQSGGFSKSYMNAIGVAETGDAWSGKGPQWRQRVETSDGWMGGGLAIADPTWIDYGGKEFAPTAELATPLQQMVIKNRIAIFGYKRKIKPGKAFPAGTTSYNPPLGTGGHSFNRAFKSDNKSRIPLPENFNENIDLLSQIGKISKSYGSENNAFANKEARDAYVKYFTKKPKSLNIITMPFTGEKIFFRGKGTGAKIVDPDLRFIDFASNLEGYAIGGLVNKKKKKTSAADFRMADYIGDWDIQRITHNAEQEIKNSKKSIFQKIGGAIKSPFVKIGNAIKSQFENNLYGYNTGKGITGSAANFKRMEDPDFQGLGTIMSIPSVRAGAQISKSLVETGAPISGAYFSIEKALDKKRSTANRSMNAAFAALGLIGPTTVFAPNYGYMSGARNLPKLGSTVSENLDVLKNVDVPKNPMALELYRGPIVPQNIIYNQTRESTKWTEKIFQKVAEIYDIGGQKVAFGVDKQFKAKYPFVKTLERNPYAITNIDPLSKKGVKIANDYLHAVAANFEEGGAATRVDALLYAMTKGDMKAGLEFNRLAGLGKRMRPQQSSAEFLEELGAKYPGIISEMERMGIDKFDPKNLFLVHETKYKPFIDSFGNAILKPTSDYQTKFHDITNIEEAVDRYMSYFGNSNLDPIPYALERKEAIQSYINNARASGHTISNGYIFGNTKDYYRDTIHFSLNHLVTGHGLRENLDEGYVIVANLMETLKRNPGSLDNLYAVDTYLTPKPGKGIVFPKGTFDIVPAGEGSRANVANLIHNRVYPNSSFSDIPQGSPSAIIPGGDHGSSSSEWTAYVRALAKDLGVTSGPHFESVSQRISGLDNYELFNHLPAYWENLSPNEIARLFHTRNPFTGIANKVKTIRDVGFFNGGLIQSFEKGGLVKGKDKTSAGQFRMFDSISDFDIQRITYNAEQQAKKGKKNIFQKIGGAIASPFKGVKNALQKEMFGAMYGKGTGTTGSYADTYKGFAEATKDANIFNPRGLGNYEAPAGSIFANEALRQGMSMIRTGMDFTPSGGIMSAGNAADKNRSGLSRLGWALASYGAIAGNPTIFAPNSGYMSGTGKGIKGVSNLQKTIQEASNIEQFFPGTRIPMPSGLTPTLSQETGRILNLIGATASDSTGVFRRELLPFSPDSTYVQALRSRVYSIRDRYFNISRDVNRSEAVREIARSMWYRTSGWDSRGAGIQAGASSFREAAFPVSDFFRIARSSGRFSEEQILEALSKASIRAEGFNMYGYSDFDRFMDALYTGNIINRPLPGLLKYPPYIDPETIAKIAQQKEIRKNVIDNINISKSIRLARARGVLSGKDALRAFRDQMILEAEVSPSGRGYSLNTWQKLSDGGFGNTSKFSFSVDEIDGSLDVTLLERGNSFGSSIDLMKMLSYVYSEIMVPKGIKTIHPGSTSVHSTAMVLKLKEVFKKFDPSIKFATSSGREWEAHSLNSFDFGDSPYLYYFSPHMSSRLDADNVFKDPYVRQRTHQVLKTLIQDSKGIVGESKQSIRDRIGGYANGGFVNAFASQGVPAILHGGEYVINSSAVKNLGISALQALNDMRFNTPKSPSYSGPVQPQTSSTSTVHIYVDNFIGEKQWFESMMKDYNINVAPQNQKAAGLNNTTISTYRGINRGL